VAQESFHKAFLHLNNFQEKSRFSTWLTRIVMNQASCCFVEGGESSKSCQRALKMVRSATRMRSLTRILIPKNPVGGASAGNS
jgi:hypothetical protein